MCKQIRNDSACLGAASLWVHGAGVVYSDWQTCRPRNVFCQSRLFEATVEYFPGGGESLFNFNLPFLDVVNNLCYISAKQW